MKMEKNILSMKPVRFLDFWEVKGKPPFCEITVRGVTGIYELNKISSFIWLHLDGTHTVSSIIDEICNKFKNVERKQVEQDVIEVLQQHESYDLIILDYNHLYPYKELKTIKKIERERRKSTGISRSVRRKQKNDVLLIVPPSPLVYPRMFVQSMGGQDPLGIGYIASLLQTQGFQVDCLNLYLGFKNLAALEHRIKTTKPKVIGLSTMTENYQNGIFLARFIKKIHPSAIVVFGGPHVTFMYKEALSNTCVDIVVKREGEYTMLELANYFVRGKGALNDIRGIVYKSNGNIIRTAVRPIIEDLDNLPFPIRNIPDLDGILSPQDVRQAVITSRGCPGKCKFCGAAALSGGRYRMRSVNNIANELTDLKRKGARIVSFGDDTMSADLNRLLNLCNIMKDLRLKWSGECRVDAMTEDLAKTLVNSGCLGLQFGVESGSQELLDHMRKDITLQQVERSVEWATKAGLFVVCSLMIGLPEDTLETMEQTIDFAEKLQKNYDVGAVLACTTPYPGTYYYNHSKDMGISLSTTNYDLWSTINPIMDMPHLTRWQIRNAYFHALPRLFQSLSSKYRKVFSEYALFSLSKEGYRLNLSNMNMFC
jgi:anaerobic magnesium-protoporphyrin IX monomethyl ester cyclase